jgi:hypothetical protein
MAYQSIGLGTTAGDGTGDSIRDGGDKVNDNFVEIYTVLGTGTALSSGISATATVITLASPVITGVLALADGSVSAPSFTNDGDTNTGIYFGAADTVNVTTGGTKRVDIDSSGLDVTGAITATTTITASGGVAGTTGTFSGAVAGTTGTFSGAVAGTTGTFSSTVQGTTITATTAFVPDASDGAALGTAALEFSDLFLADGAVIALGDDQEITLTHVADTGLNLKHAASGDDKYPTLTLQTGDTDIASADKLGVINFQAPDEGAGTDAILVAAGIEAVSEGDFSTTNNATKLSFKTASTDTAAETMSLSSGGNLTVTGTITGSHGLSIAIGKALAVAMLF